MSHALPRRAPAYRGLVLILGLVIALGPLSIDMYLPSFEAIAADLGVAVSDVQLSLSAYLAGLATGQLFYGVLTERFGRRRPLLFGLLLYVAGSAACAAAPDLGLFVAARFLQALGGCAGMVISRAVVRDRFDVQDSARLYSTLMLVMGLAPILAPLAGGQILALAGWRAIFVALIGAGLATFALVYSALSETLPHEERDTRPLRRQLGATIAVVGHRRFVRFAIANAATMAGMFSYIAGSPLVFMELHGLTPTTFAALFGANAFGIISASQANRWLSVRFGVERVLNWGIWGVAAGFAGFAAAAAAGGGLVALVAPLFVGVTAVGLVMPNATASAMAPFGAGAGRASAVMGLIQSAAGAVATALMTLLADGSAVPLAAVLATCALIARLALPGRERT